MSTTDELEGKLATYEHIDKIRELLRLFANELVARGETHDRSKLSPAESEMFGEFSPKLKGCTYGSDEYKSFLAAMKPALDHHYANNRHHPEHHTGGIDGMNLLDVLEMFIDWTASSRRHADGDMRKSIEVNRKRFEMAPQLVRIFQNTLYDMQLGRLSTNKSEAFKCGFLHCILDGSENAPFSCVGGLANRAELQRPQYISEADWPDYRAGYEYQAFAAYGPDWRTCEFGWSPALTIGGEGSGG